DAVGHRARAQGCGQTGHAAAVSETGAMIDSIGADDCAGELLQQVILFVRTLRRGQKGDAVRAVALANLTEAAGNVVEGGVPTVFLESSVAVGAHERPGQPVRRVDVIVSEAPLDTEIAAIYQVIAAPVHTIDKVVFNVYVKLAADATIGTGGMDN